MGSQLKFAMLRRQAGFTLLEVMVVLFIMAGLMAVVGPSVGSGRGGVDIKTATRQLAAGLRKARAVAITQRRDAVLTLDTEGKQFALSGSPQTYALPRDLDYGLFTTESEKLDNGKGNVRFYPDGSSTGGRITVAAGERKFFVDIEWLSGRVIVSQ